ncbi:YdeI/OmpD-associated family protein [Paenibacillus sp. YIM B09110]|uniref:YdeI/OmpD-associated family protein n=1 Tax=Paenibacillus sp. YIM B09110 TaxID=3126102 RepID=UPI00301D8E69
MKFQATVLLAKKSATGIEVPATIVEGLGAGKKPAVKVTIGDYSYRSTVASMSGTYMLPLSAEHRAGASIQAGDTVEVDIVLDDNEPREVTLPSDFLEELDRNPSAKAFFENLSYSNKRRFLLNIEGAKTSETRTRRLEKTIAALNEGRLQ